MPNPNNPNPPWPNLNNPETPDNNNPNVNLNQNAQVTSTPSVTGVQYDSITTPGVYVNTKGSYGSVFPEKVVSGHPYSRMEALITPQQVRNRFLFGIPLYSNQKNPLTGQRDAITDEMIKSDFLPRAVMWAEQACHIDIFPVQRAEKQPFDKALYEAFGYFLTEHKPVLSMEKLSITPSNNVDVYVVPLQWVESSYFARGQINIVPLTAAFQGAGFLPPSQASGGAAFLQILGSKSWIPAYWQILYTSGFPDGQVPILLNELIGNFVAKMILEMLASTNKIGSYGLNMDGAGQNVNTGGTNVYDARLQRIDENIDSLVNKVKAIFSIKMIATNV